MYQLFKRNINYIDVQKFKLIKTQCIMKKITLFIFLLAAYFGYAQTDSNYCSTEVLHLDIPAEINSAINLTIQNTGANTMKVTAAAADITFLDLVGSITGGPTKSAADTSVPGEISITLTWAVPPVGDVVFQFTQWRKTSTGGATWQKNDATTPFDGVCGPPPGPEEDTSLSDLQLDGVTIAGFGSATTSYDIGVESGNPIPQVTTVTATNPSATIGSITQASAVPGSATFDVTSEDTNNVQTYTINFFASTPPTNSPTPPTLGAADVRSIFSDAYTPVTTLVYNPAPQADIANTYDTNWCGASTVAFPIGGETVNKTTDLGCEGIDFQAGRFDATDFDTVHIDIWTTSETQDKSFNILLSQWNGGTGQAYALEFSVTNASSPASLPTTNPGTWIPLDIPLASFSNYGSGVTDIVQAVLVSNMPTIFYDNFYLYKSSALSTKNFEIAGLNVYPNPAQDSWTVKTQNIKMSSIQVFDMLGKQVLSLKPEATEAIINASQLRTGLYFAKISTANGSTSLKLIKE